MALYIGDTLISGEVEGQKLNLPFSLFQFQFTDHLLNNASWLRADTFSWQSGEIYVTAYEHLVDDIDGITAETETIAGYTVTFYRATDGHKICLANQESMVADIFTATGVAWYYILDTANTRFKLPRTKFGVTGLRSYVGDSVNLAATGSDLKATQSYLYFYVGETVQDANLIAAGQALTDIADLKAHYIVETYVNGASWYRVYSDGWCEQGGRLTATTAAQGYQSSIVLLKDFTDTNYTALATTTNQSSYASMAAISSKATTGFALGWYGVNTANLVSEADWYACGYIS